MSIQEQLQYSLDKSRYWKSKISNGLCGDRGSYCENPDKQYTHANKILKSYEELVNLLVDWERKYDE